MMSITVIKGLGRIVEEIIFSANFDKFPKALVTVTL